MPQIENNESKNKESEGHDFANPQNSMESIIKNGGTVTDNNGEHFFCLSIIGQIEGHYLLDEKQKATKYEHLIPMLVALEESTEIDGILIILNTMGGDVEAGLAIAELIGSMKKPTASLVLGGGHSIGVPLAVSAKHSFIVPSATMTIHPVRTSGTLIGAPQTFDYLRKMQDRIIDFITSHSNVDGDYLRRIMMEKNEMANDIGTVLDGNAAVECGLIDRVGGLSDALAYLRELSRSEKGNA